MQTLHAAWCESRVGCHSTNRTWLKSSSELQIRIEQVLTANLPLVLCFKVSQLLAFYGRTVEQMMGSGARLTDTLADCHRLANRVFHEQLTARGNKLMQFKAAPPKDLALPQQVLRPDYMCWDAELTAYLSCCAVLSCAELCCLVLCWFADR